MPATITKRTDVWDELAESKHNRDGFMAGYLAADIPRQITTIRESLGWTKKQLAEKTGIAANRISLLEQEDYDNYTISTLKRIASAFDVALSVQFVSFSQLVNQQIFNSYPIPIPFMSDSIDNSGTAITGIGMLTAGNFGTAFVTYDVSSPSSATTQTPAVDALPFLPSNNQKFGE